MVVKMNYEYLKRRGSKSALSDSVLNTIDVSCLNISMPPPADFCIRTEPSAEQQSRTTSESPAFRSGRSPEKSVSLVGDGVENPMGEL